MCPHGYYTLMRESKDPPQLRLRMVQAAKRLGAKPAARLFATSPKTVRKWRERFDGTLASLRDQSRAPIHRPRKVSPQAEAEILRARKRLPVWGAERLKRDMQLPYSVKVIRRVLREHGLLRRWRRKKHEVKRCLREVKRLWPLWKQICIDTKDLCDLPEYWLQAQLRGLPRYQYTAREVSCGVLFLAFSNELSLTYADLLAGRITKHLAKHHVDLSRVTVQTDNGSEFIGSWQANAPSQFTWTILNSGAVHRTIPPGQHRFQADVETVHSLMELEFYLEPFKNRQDFISKAATYQDFFNYLRPNSGKENKCPWQLVQEKNSTAKASLLDLHPVFLEDLHYQVLHPLPEGNDVWAHP
jgi:transposase